MSLPKHPTSHSSSPSKSSLRSTTGTGTIKQPTTRALLPSPHFEEPILAHSQSVEQEEEEEQDDGPEGREYDGSTFLPFFTLIEDTLTHTHHHPTVHYIFADDDTDIVTEAACRSLVQDDPLVTTTSETARPSGQQPDPDLDAEPSRLPTAVPGVREHYLLLDVEPVTSPESTTTGYEVTRAHSLSAEWQVTSTSISSAPAIDAVDDGAEESEGLMLRIDGRGVVPSDDNEENGTGNGKGSRERETLEEMVRRFETGLADIRRAIESGGSLHADEQEEVGD